VLKDTPLRLKRRLVTLGVCAALLSAMWGLTLWPAGLERWYAQGVGFRIARALSWLSGLWRPSLAEFILGGLVVSVLASIVIGIVQCIRRQRTIRHLILSGFLR
jgi:hypothetical protein